MQSCYGVADSNKAEAQRLYGEKYPNKNSLILWYRPSAKINSKIGQRLREQVR